MKAEAINFEERAVAFLDILGFTNFIRNAEVEESEEYQKLCELKAVIEADLDVSEFHIKLKPTCTYISDSIILSAPVCGNNYSGLVGVAIKSTQIAHRLFDMGFLVRGGISVGKAAHDTNIYGSGYLDAYETQDKRAINPRILLDEKAAKILDDDKTYQAHKLRELSNFLKEGNDWIVDTLNPHSSYIGGNEKDPFQLFEAYRNTIIKNLENFSLGCKQRGKWEWMADFFNDRLRRYGNDIRSVEQIELPMPPTHFRQGWVDDETDSDWMAPFKAPGHTVTLNAAPFSDRHCEKS